MIKKLLLLATLMMGLGLSPARVLAAAVEPAGEGQKASAAHEEEKPGELMSDPTSAETWSSALWTIIIFVVMLIILYPTAWKSVLAGLRAREERIRKDIADAEAASARAGKVLEEYNAKLATAEGQIREMLAKATKDAERLATDIRSKAQLENEEAKTRATREIEAAKKQALSEIYASAAEISTSIASKILRRSINADDQRDLVSRSLEELQTVKS